jgi:hypothetical protein
MSPGLRIQPARPLQSPNIERPRRRSKPCAPKDGVKISTESGWTVIEDQSTLSVWSFTPSGHPAFPAAVHRQVIQEGNNLFVKMNVLCEAPKAACDTMVAEFQKLNGQVRDDLKR